MIMGMKLVRACPKSGRSTETYKTGENIQQPTRNFQLNIGNQMHTLLGNAENMSRVPGFLFPPRRTPPTFRKSRSGGSVLILALWVLFFLAALTVAVGTHVSAAISAADRLWSRMEARSLAEAGAQQAFGIAMQQTNAWDGVARDAWNRAPSAFTDISVGEGLCSIRYRTVGPDGIVETNAGLVGEDGKLNLNTIVKSEESKLALEVLLTTIGELDAEGAEQVVAAIADWIDADDEMLTGGAESGYYATLSPPYKCVNAPMRCMSELRLVKGVSRELYARLVSCLTVYGSELVNVNCAPEPVIAALAQAHAKGSVDPDACVSLAEKIGAFRSAGGAFRTDDDILNPPEDIGLTGDERALFRGIPPSGLDRSSTVFRGVASGDVEAHGGSKMSIEFVLDTGSGTFVYWQEW
jgi:general secretion pathway protein K